MAQVDPDREAALRRLQIDPATLGLVEVLRIVDHNHDQDQDNGEPIEEGKRDPPAER